MNATEMRAVRLANVNHPEAFPNRVRVVDAGNCPKTVRGKLAGGLPDPAHQGREGVWVGDVGLDWASVWLDGDSAPSTIMGSSLILLP